MPLTFDHNRAPMSAHVRKTANGAFIIRGENQRLAETSVEESERKNAPRRLYARRITHPLPAPREDAVLLQLEVLRVRIHPRGERGRSTDVLVDLEIARCHLELTQTAVSLRPSISVELPHIPDFADLIEIQVRRDQLVFVAARLCYDLSARIAEVALPVELSDVPGLLEADAVDRSDEERVGYRVRRLLELP